jgi:hypothetical protein
MASPMMLLAWSYSRRLVVVQVSQVMLFFDMWFACVAFSLELTVSSFVPAVGGFINLKLG